MTALTAAKRRRKNGAPAYSLDEQIGFILRQVSQRHTTLFTRGIGDDTTPTQWAALAKLFEIGPCSQNLLGRLTAMDVATIKGVVDRLTIRGLTQTEPDPGDGRRLIVALTKAGRALTEQTLAKAAAISEETLAPLTESEREVLITLLKKMR
jgi:DNA-binding MarR family transcriptional regulator